VKTPRPGASERNELRQRYERRMQLKVPAGLDMLRGLKLFAGIPEKARDKVIEKVRRYIHVASFSKDEVVLREGDYSDSAFYIVSGSVEIVLPGSETRHERPRVRGGAHAGRPAPTLPSAAGMMGKPPGSGTIMLSSFPVDVVPGARTLLGADEIFGELSALSRYPVSATVRADEPLVLLQLRLPALRMLMAASKEFKAFLDRRYRERTLARHLRNVPLFAEVDEDFLGRVKAQAELLTYEPGQLVVAEGTPAESFFLVRGGYLKVSVATGASQLAVTYLRKGDYAGEVALLLDEPWPFSLEALEHVELVRLGRDGFRELLAAYPAVQDALWSISVERLKARGAVLRDPVSSEYVQMAMDTGLIHGESVLLIDLATCTRCDDCVRGCASAHGGEPRFIREGVKYRNWLVPTACYQCTDPVCMMDCPTGAITRQMGTLEVTIDEPTCIGCTNCAQRCPWGNIIMIERDE
jgi:CRP-like cAMP-binding protein/Pyruvate/2-oxoacid:ferredoxin oxidoreductase delta subunit